MAPAPPRTPTRAAMMPSRPTTMMMLPMMSHTHTHPSMMRPMSSPRRTPKPRSIDQRHLVRQHAPSRSAMMPPMVALVTPASSMVKLGHQRPRRSVVVLMVAVVVTMMITMMMMMATRRPWWWVVLLVMPVLVPVSVVVRVVSRWRGRWPAVVAVLVAVAVAVAVLVMMAEAENHLVVVVGLVCSEGVVVYVCSRSSVRFLLIFNAWVVWIG